jgi:hypothetical protein
VKLQQRYAAALLARGETRVVSSSTKWIKMTRKSGGFYFLGKSGSLRYGGTRTNSKPTSHDFKEKLLKGEWVVQ